jgi:uroporphyrinogen decarboxylase
MERGTSVTNRERVLAAIARKEPDRVPIDIGSTSSSSINIHAYTRLREFLGLPPETPRMLSARGATVIPSEDVLVRLGIDTGPVVVGPPDGRPDRYLSDSSMIDEWGVTWTRPEGGHYITTDGPFYAIEEPCAADLEKLAWPEAADPGRYRGIREQARAVRLGGRAAILHIAVGPVHISQFTRGFASWMEDLAARPAFAAALAERITDVWVAIAERALDAAAGEVDAVVMYDDIGGQRGPLFSPKTYRSIIKPSHRRMIETVKRRGIPVLWHTCGSVYRLIPDLIEIGIDILNPVQVSSEHMDTRVLKSEFGRDIAFWGAIDTRDVLPRGTPAQVREEVRRRIEDLGAGGGYVVAAVHNIQADVPPENIVAMCEAALEFGRY